MRYGLLLLAVLTSQALATDLVVTVGSYHSRNAGKYNAFNPGIGVEQNINDRWKLAGGYYYNSNRKDSWYAGAIYTRWQIGEVRIGTSLGLVTGYGKDALPMLAPMVMWRNLNFMVVPPVGKDAVAVVGLQIKVPL